MFDKQNALMFWGGLFLWLLGTLGLMVWALPRDFYAMSDQFLTLYGVMAIHEFGIQHFDFQLITRAGFLLSYPQYVIGMSVTGMKVLFTISLFVTAALSYACFIKDKAQRWLLPLFLFLIFMSCVCFYRFMFNYYGNVTIFLTLSVAFAYAGRFRQQTILSILSSLCFVILAFSTLPLILLVVPGVVILSLVDRSKQAWIQFVSFIVLFAIASWIFFIDWGLWQRLVENIGSLNVAPLRGVLLVHEEIIWMLAFILFSIIFVIVARMEAPKKGKPIFRVVWPIALVLMVIFMAVIINFKSTAWQSWTLALKILCWSLFTFPIITLCFKKIDRKKAWFYTISILLVSALVFANRLFSRAYGIEFLYFPTLWILGLAFLYEAGELPRFWKRPVLFWLIVLGVIAFGVMRFNIFKIHILSIRMNTVYLPQVGFRVSANAARVYSNMIKEYEAHRCKDKAFMALEDLPDAYWIFNRRAPFDQSWISRLILTPFNEQTTGQNIVGYLESKPNWCVVYTTYGDGFMSKAEKAIGRALILPYLTSANTHKSYLGAFRYRVGEDGREKLLPLQVYFYVKG